MRFSDRGHFLLKLIPVVLIMALLSSSAEAQSQAPGGSVSLDRFGSGTPFAAENWSPAGNSSTYLPFGGMGGFVPYTTGPGQGLGVMSRTGQPASEHVERANGDAWSNFEPRPDPWKHHAAGSTGGHEQRNGAGRDVWYLDTTHAIGRQDGSNETCPGGELSFPDPAQLARPRHPLAGHVDVRPKAPSTPMYDTRAFFRDRLGRNDASYLEETVNLVWRSCAVRSDSSTTWGRKPWRSLEDAS